MDENGLKFVIKTYLGVGGGIGASIVIGAFFLGKRFGKK